MIYKEISRFILSFIQRWQRDSCLNQYQLYCKTFIPLRIHTLFPENQKAMYLTFCYLKSDFCIIYDCSLLGSCGSVKHDTIRVCAATKSL